MRELWLKCVRCGRASRYLTNPSHVVCRCGGGLRFMEEHEAVVHRTRHGKVRSRVNACKRARIYERDGWACVKCGATEGLTLDHIRPLSKGGRDRDGNLQTMCEPCNSAKANRMPPEQSAARSILHSEGSDG